METSQPEQQAPESKESLDLETLLKKLPPAPKLHVALENYEKKYFPVSHQVHAYTDEAAWRADPRAQLEQIWTKCQQIIGSPSKAVHEIRTAAPIPRKALLSYLVHRRTEKMPPFRSRDLDKPSQRPNDFYRVEKEIPNNSVNSQNSPHQIIRFYSSCICRGCLMQQSGTGPHRPYVLIYFPILSARTAAELRALVGLGPTAEGADAELPKLLTKKVKLERTDPFLTNFFIKVVKPHHAQCQPTVRGVELWTGIKTWIQYLKAYFDLVDLARLDGAPTPAPMMASEFGEIMENDSNEDVGDGDQDLDQGKRSRKKRPRNEDDNELDRDSIINSDKLPESQISSHYLLSGPGGLHDPPAIDPGAQLDPNLHIQDLLLQQESSHLLDPPDSTGEGASFPASPFEFHQAHRDNTNNNFLF